MLTQHEAATRIQAAYKGFATRKNMQADGNDGNSVVEIAARAIRDVIASVPTKLVEGIKPLCQQVGQSMAPKVKTAVSAVAVTALVVGLARRLRRKMWRRDGKAGRSLKLVSWHVYPVKGCGGVHVNADKAKVAVTARGLAYDRAFVVVNADGVKKGMFASQRDCPQMAKVKVNLPLEALVLEDPETKAVVECTYEGKTLRVPLAPSKDGDTVDVNVWGTNVEGGRDCGDDAAAFFSHVCKKNVRLLRYPDATGIRRCDPKYVARQDELHVTANTGGAYCDGFPLLACLASSIRSVAEAMGISEEESLQRFRPNVVFSSGKDDDSSPFADDSYSAVCINEWLSLKYVKPCARCSVTLVHPSLGVRKGGPRGVTVWDALKRLRRHGSDMIHKAPQRWRNDRFFGWNALVSVHRDVAELRLGSTSFDHLSNDDGSWWGGKLGELCVGDPAYVTGYRTFRAPKQEETKLA